MSLMLVRLKDSRKWVWPLWTLTAIQICLIIVATTVQLSFCRPISGIWNPTPETKCISPEGMMIYAYIYSGKCTFEITRLRLPGR
jgi:hypothetical protein